MIKAKTELELNYELLKYYYDQTFLYSEGLVSAEWLSVFKKRLDHLFYRLNQYKNQNGKYPQVELKNLIYVEEIL